MKKLTSFVLIISFLISILSTLTACTDVSHKHTYAEGWTYSDESHWKSATCEHNVKESLSAHSFDDGQIADTYVIYTCEGCGYQKTATHTHEFGEWSVITPATISKSGEEARACKYVGCTASESRVISKIELSSIFVATYPAKLDYIIGETFDPTGIVIHAIGADGSHTDVTSLVTYDKTILAETDTTVTVSYEGKSAIILISVISLSNHAHTYEGEWQISENATIFASGEKYRECTFPECTERETEEIAKIQIVGITVTTPPTRLDYISGESFDPTGILVTATDENGASTT